MLTAALVLGSLAAAALTNIFFHREISAGRVLSDGDSLTAVRFEALAGYEDYLVFSSTGEVSFNLRAALNETGSQGGFNGEALFSIGSENHELFSVTNHSDLPVQLLMIDTTGGLSLQGSPGVLSPGVTGYYYYTIATAGIDPGTPIGGTLRVTSDLESTENETSPTLPMEPPSSVNLADVSLEEAIYSSSFWTGSENGIVGSNFMFFHPAPLAEYTIRSLATLSDSDHYGGYGLAFETSVNLDENGNYVDTGYILQFDRVFGDFIIRPRVDGNEKSPLRDLVKARTDAYNLPGRDDDDFWTAEHEILVTVRQGVEEGSKSIDISLDGVLIYENYLIQSTLTASENHIGLRSWFTPTEYHWLSATPLD